MWGLIHLETTLSNDCTYAYRHYLIRAYTKSKESSDGFSIFDILVGILRADDKSTAPSTRIIRSTSAISATTSGDWQ